MVIYLDVFKVVALVSSVKLVIDFTKGEITMKKAIVAMLLMAVFLLGGGGLISIVFSSIAGGGVEQSFIYPIYAGIIVLAGLIVGAVDIIVNEIRELKKAMEKK